MTHPNDELRVAFEKWLARRHGLSTDAWADTGNYKSHATRDWWEAWQEASNTHANDDAKGGDAVAEVCYDSYGFGRMVWLKDFGKGNQPPHGSLLYTSPRPTADDARDAERLEWMIYHGTQVLHNTSSSDQGWYVCAIYHMGISSVDDFKRFKTPRDAIDAAMAKRVK